MKSSVQADHRPGTADGAVVDLPQWKCHKVVRAAKISMVGVSSDTDKRRLYLDCGGFVDVDANNKHAFEQGGYFVRYEDGYESFSPAAPFESGYTRV